MTTPFTGTQAQLADELDRWADEASDRGMVIIARTYTNAAALVRNAIITPNPLQAAAPDMLAALEAAKLALKFSSNSAVLQIAAAIAKSKGTPDV